MAIGRLISPIPAVWMMDKYASTHLFFQLVLIIVPTENRYGRKATLLASAIPIVIGYILLAVTQSVLPFIYLARFFFGLAHGAAFSIVLPIYVAEIASTRIRRRLTIVTVGLLPKIGICLSYVIAPLVTIQTFSLIALVLPAVFVLIFAWMPESPQFLVGHLQPDQALRSLTLLRGHRDVIREFDEIEARQKARKNDVSAIARILSPENRHALYTVLAMAAATALTGTEVIQFYSQSIFQTLGLVSTTVDAAVILNMVFGIILIASTSVATITVDTFLRQRKQTLVRTTIGLAISNAILATSFFVNRQLAIDQNTFGWLPMLAMIAYIISYSFGLATVSHAIIDDILPIDLKTVANVFFTLLVSALSVLSTLFYEMASEELVFGAFTIFSVCFVVLIWRKLPDQMLNSQ